MVDVIALKPGEAIPDGRAAVVVAPAEDGSGAEISPSWTYFSYLPNVPGARERRLAEATAYAEGQGIRCVYVLEVGPAEYVAGTESGLVVPLKTEGEAG
jgi:hypothetical protein